MSEHDVLRLLTSTAAQLSRQKPGVWYQLTKMDADSICSIGRELPHPTCAHSWVPDPDGGILVTRLEEAHGLQR